MPDVHKIHKLSPSADAIVHDTWLSILDKPLLDQLHVFAVGELCRRMGKAFGPDGIDADYYLDGAGDA